MAEEDSIILYDVSQAKWLLFTKPCEILTTKEPGHVIGVLDKQLLVDRIDIQPHRAYVVDLQIVPSMFDDATLYRLPAGMLVVK